MFQITGFHHRICIGRLLSWGNIFPAGELLHKGTKVWSWQGYREHTDSQPPKHRHRKQSKQVVGKKKKYLNVFTYTHYWSIQDQKKKKKRASCREFPVILKMKGIFSLKKIKVQSSQRLLLSWSSWQLRLTYMETGILPTIAFLSLQFVISWSLLSSFWTDTSSSHTSKTPLFIPESPVHETQWAEQPLAVS